MKEDFLPTIVRREAALEKINVGLAALEDVPQNRLFPRNLC